MPPEPPLVEKLMLLVKSLPAHHREPVDLLCFPSDSTERFINRSGTFQLSREDIPHLRFEGVRP